MTHREKKRHRALLKEIGRQTGALHACGFGHGDLRLSNILVCFEVERPLIYFLDNERTTFYGNVPERIVVKNLTQINVDSIQRLSATDRLRIFKAYLQAAEISASRRDQRKILGKIFKRTHKRLQKNDSA
jgi:tRNA A-37 threonylcarbamoyl transferase component Bud32